MGFPRWLFTSRPTHDRVSGLALDDGSGPPTSAPMTSTAPGSVDPTFSSLSTEQQLDRVKQIQEAIRIAQMNVDSYRWWPRRLTPQNVIDDRAILESHTTFALPAINEPDLVENGKFKFIKTQGERYAKPVLDPGVSMRWAKQMSADRKTAKAAATMGQRPWGE